RVTGVQTRALPLWRHLGIRRRPGRRAPDREGERFRGVCGSAGEGGARSERFVVRSAADGRVARERVLVPGEAMNGTIVELTFRQLLSQRRTIALVLAALVPVAVATAYRLTPPEAFELSESGVPFSRHQRFVAAAPLS